MAHGTWHGRGLWHSKTELARNMGITSDRPRRNKDFDFPDDPNPIRFVNHDPSGYGEDQGVLYARLKRDGWKRAGSFGKDRKVSGKRTLVIHEGDSGWIHDSNTDWPPIRMFYRKYQSGKGYVFEFTMDDHPNFFSPSDDWATFDSLNNLIIARNGQIEKWSPLDFKNNQPSFTLDLNNLTPPEPIMESITDPSPPKSPL